MWDYDEDALSRDGNTFTGLVVGTTRLAYGNGETEAYFDIVVRASELPSTGQDMPWVWLGIGGTAIALGAGLTLRLRRRAARS